MFICGDCLEVLSGFGSNSIDLVVTSPPYSTKRAYGGVVAEEYADWLFRISCKLMEVLKPSGSLVINIKEGCKQGVRELYVLEYILKMAKAFLWIDSYVWVKTNPFPTGSKKRLKDGWEYCLHFTKSKDYKFYPNNVLVKGGNKWGQSGRKNKSGYNVRNGSGLAMGKRIVGEMVRPSNVITFPSSCLNLPHPAVYPINLPSFFISLLSEEGDSVLDPFIGSGTTALAAIGLKRKCIGIDIQEKYINLCKERCSEHTDLESMYL